MRFGVERRQGRLAAAATPEAERDRDERLYQRPRQARIARGQLQCPICGASARRFLAFGLAGCLGRHQTIVLTDILDGTHNPERRTNDIIAGLCAHQQTVQEASGTRAGFPFRDMGHLERFGGIFTATHPLILDSRGAVNATIADLIEGDLQTLLPSGFDPEIPWAARSYVWLFVVGNGPLSDHFASACADSLDGCAVLGAVLPLGNPLQVSFGTGGLSPTALAADITGVNVTVVGPINTTITSGFPIEIFDLRWDLLVSDTRLVRQ